MIENALLHSTELAEKFKKTWYDDKYKYYYSEGYGTLDQNACNPNVSDSCWQRSFVSIGYEGEIIGYIAYRLDRSNTIAEALRIISFNDAHHVQFCIDLKTVLSDIFEKYNMEMLFFTAVVGNPALPKYEKILKLIGGKEIGVAHNRVRLMDNSLCDLKYFEVSKENYYKFYGNKENVPASP